MRLVRYGDRGLEKPGVIDGNDQVRDLSQHVKALAASALDPASLSELQSLDIDSLPIV